MQCEHYNHILSQYTVHSRPLWLNQASLMHSTPNKADTPDRSPILCAAAVIFSNTCLDLTISCGSLHFTLYPNRLAVFTSKVIILPFIAAKKATCSGFCRNKHPCQYLKPKPSLNFYFLFFHATLILMNRQERNCVTV